MLSEKPRNKRAAYGMPADPENVLRSAADIQMAMSAGINMDGSLKPKAILAVLKLKGIAVTPLAELHGYSEAYFRQVIERIKRDPRVEDIISESIGFEPNRMWGRQPAA